MTLTKQFLFLKVTLKEDGKVLIVQDEDVVGALKVLFVFI